MDSSVLEPDHRDQPIVTATATINNSRIKVHPQANINTHETSSMRGNHRSDYRPYQSPSVEQAYIWTASVLPFGIHRTLHLMRHLFRSDPFLVVGKTHWLTCIWAVSPFFFCASHFTGHLLFGWTELVSWCSPDSSEIISEQFHLLVLEVLLTSVTFVMMDWTSSWCWRHTLKLLYRDVRLVC